MFGCFTSFLLLLNIKSRSMGRVHYFALVIVHYAVSTRYEHHPSVLKLIQILPYIIFILLSSFNTYPPFWAIYIVRQYAPFL